MILKNLNDVSIYIVPLCDNNITWRDLTVESGFINAFTIDKNRPFLEDKVFLVYDSSVNTAESLETHSKMCKLDSYYNKCYITINKKHYTVYCLSNPKYSEDIKRLRNNGKPLTLDAMLEIYRFWQGIKVPELEKRLFYSWYRFGDSIEAELPEEDCFKKQWD